MSNTVETYMPLVIEKYLGDTGHLTTLQHGAYLLLLMHYWRRGAALPDDDARLAATAKMSPAEWKKNRAVLAEFFTIGDGVWRQKRAEHELDRARRKSEAAAESARKRWGDAKPMRTHSGRNAKADALHDAKPMRGGCSSIHNSPDASASGRGRAPRGKPKSPMPDDWAPKDRHHATAEQRGLSLALEAQKARNWAASKDARYADWDRFFDNWLLNAKEAGNGQRNGSNQREIQLAAARASAGYADGGRAAWSDPEGDDGADRGGTDLAARIAH